MDRIPPASVSNPHQAIRNLDDAARENANALHQRPPASARPLERPQGASAGTRLRRLVQFHQKISDNAFDQKSAASKIDWLLRGVRESREGRNLYLSQIAVGSRRLSNKEALCLALENGIASARDKVPEVCEELIARYEAEEVKFTLFGVAFPRSRVAEWARHGLTNVDGVTCNNSVVEDLGDLEQALYVDNSQNVYDPAISIAMQNQLRRIANLVPEEMRISQTAAGKEIRDYLRSLPSHGLPLAGYYLVAPEKTKPFFRDYSIREALTIMWNYIRAVPDQELQTNLKDAMAGRLIEIAEVGRCSTGNISRLIDIPSGIDLANTQSLSVQQLRDELQTMAARVSNEFDAENQEYVDAIKLGSGAPHLITDTDIQMPAMKRERFLITADVDFGLIRGIDRQLVRMHAERVFPKGTIL